MIKAAIIGSTGSIGTQALDVVRKSNGELKVVSLAAGGNAVLLQQQIDEFNPSVATLERGEIDRNSLETFVGEGSYLNAVTKDCDVVLVAMSGFKAYYAIEKAIDLKIDVALANKEAIVSAGDILLKKARENGVKVFPVDSEHSAVYQCLKSGSEIDKIILTASGGSLRDYTPEMLKKVTAEEVLNHPTWVMGKKITVDSATMLNKGFEVIEAMRLFDCGCGDVDVVIHKDSIVHSMVAFKDGAVVAQMGKPSMKTPISYALYKGARKDAGVDKLDFTNLTLDFKKVEEGKYPLYDLAREVARKGGLYPALLVAADEVAVERFLTGEIAFTKIYDVIKYALDKSKEHIINLSVTKENVLFADSTARKFAKEYK